MRRLAILLLLISGCSDDPCEGVSGTCIGLADGASATDVQTALIKITPGGTVAFGEGTFHLQTDLSLTVDNVTIQGAGMDQTVLSFKGQTSGAQGLLVTASGFTIQDIAIEDTRGDALKIEGGTGITIERTRVEWTGGPNETNGSYGLYPVQCKNVLIDGSVVKGASDAGIYVGQSDNIVVRNNRAELNVAGIEIENSTNADVHDNTATKNTGGILVFNLPGLQVENGAITRVFHNEVFDNNTTNFAPVGNIVGLVPTGTGMAILAAHQVEIFNNNIHDHKSVNFGVISYVPTGKVVDDPTYDQYPTAISVHDNTMMGTSDMPTGMLGALLISAIGEIMPNGPFIVPDMAWDGVLDPNRTYTDADRICMQNNGDADFINLAWPLNMGDLPSVDMSTHNCTLAALPEVVLP
ncbi:MAG TPA: parallel beta-helix domain-containing protein [Kofleriaceae bacterium]|nr:parallel beta-helix domain-containing protein [Kofleriaceae bacterium]